MPDQKRNGNKRQTPLLSQDLVSLTCELLKEKTLLFLPDSDLSRLKIVCKAYKLLVEGFVLRNSRQSLLRGCDVETLHIEGIGIGWQNVDVTDGHQNELSSTLRWNHGHNDRCEECGRGGDLLVCDFCNLVYHLECLNPPLFEVPDGDWACPSCLTDDKRAPVIGSAILQLRQKSCQGTSIMVTGGYHLRSFTPNTDIYELPPDRDRWILHACSGDVPVLGFGNDQAVSFGREHFVAAFSWSGSLPSSTVDFTSLYTLDTNSLHWSKSALAGEIPDARMGHSLSETVVDGDPVVFLFGGRLNGRLYQNDLYSLRRSRRGGAAVAWEWARHHATDAHDPARPSPRCRHACAAAGGKLWVLGGLGYRGGAVGAGAGTPPAGAGGRGAPPPRGPAAARRGRGRGPPRRRLGFLNDVHAYDPAAGRWARLAPTGAPPPPRAGHAAAAAGAGKLVVTGGCDGRVFFGDWHVLDAVAGAWARVAVPAAPTPRTRPALAAGPGPAGGGLVVFGGGKRGHTPAPAASVDKYRGGLYALRFGARAGAAGGAAPPPDDEDGTAPGAGGGSRAPPKPVLLLYENDADVQEAKDHRAA